MSPMFACAPGWGGVLRARDKWLSVNDPASQPFATSAVSRGAFSISLMAQTCLTLIIPFVFGGVFPSFPSEALLPFQAQFRCPLPFEASQNPLFWAFTQYSKTSPKCLPENSPRSDAGS